MKSLINRTYLMRYNFNIISLILLYSIFYILITLISNNIILSDTYYYSILSQKYDLNKIEEIILLARKYESISYLILPIFLILKWGIKCIIIYIGIELFELDISLKNCFKIVLIAEIIPILSTIIRTLYFYIYPPSSIESLQTFNPLGLIGLFDYKLIPKFFIYPIQQLNLFELSYWVLLALGIKIHGYVDFKKAFKVTTLSYGVGLVIWCIFIVFLQLQFS